MPRLISLRGFGSWTAGVRANMVPCCSGRPWARRMGFGEAVLHHVDLEWVDGIWRGHGGGGAGTFNAAEILDDLGPGLHRLGGSSADPVRLTQAIASPEVAMIELRSDRGVSSRPPGLDGFCVFRDHAQRPNHLCLGAEHRQPAATR